MYILQQQILSNYSMYFVATLQIVIKQDKFQFLFQKDILQDFPIDSW